MSEPRGGPGAHAASDRQSGAAEQTRAGAGVVADEGVGVSRRLHRFATDAARREAGGIDWWATIAGTLAALGTAVLLGGLFAAGGVASALNDVAGKTELSIGGAVAGLVTLLVAFYVGGWVAGRMARYDGARNGLLTAVWFLVLGGALAALGATAGSRYNVIRGADVPAWFDRDVVSTAGIVYAVLALVVVLGAAILGGIVGARWHRRADDALLGAREGSLRNAYPAEPGVSTRRVAGRGTGGTGGTGTGDEIVIRPEERR